MRGIFAASRDTRLLTSSKDHLGVFGGAAIGGPAFFEESLGVQEAVVVSLQPAGIKGEVDEEALKDQAGVGAGSLGKLGGDAKLVEFYSFVGGFDLCVKFKIFVSFLTIYVSIMRFMFHY